MAHFEAVVGDVGPASSFERRHAFLTAGPEMVTFLQERGVRFVYCPGYSDYYSSAKGGHDNGRGIEPVPFDGRVLGDWLEQLQPGLAQSLGLAVMTNEARSLSHYNRSIRAFAVSARVVLRTYAGTIATSGAAHQRRVADRARCCRSPSAVGSRSGRTRRSKSLSSRTAASSACGRSASGFRCSIRARQGVLLAAGGFAHNPEMREQYGGDQPNRAKWSIANPGDTGDAIRTAMAIGAKTDLMDEAWWLPSPRTGRFGQSTLDQARQRPRTIYVDAAGRRFVNESNSYMEVGKEMYARDKTSQAVPCWLIFDDRYRKRYAHLRSQPGRFPRKLLKSGMLKQAWTLKIWPPCAASIPSGWPKPSSASTSTPNAASTPTTAGANPPTTGRWVTPTTRCTPASAPSTKPPYLRGPGRAR